MLRFKKNVLLFVVVLLLFVPNNGFAEQCTDAVHALLQWTKNIRGNADQWDENANALGFTVNHSSAGCSNKTPCVLVYPKNYGHGIDSHYGHVAVLYGCGNTCNIQDSNGVCNGKTRAICSKSVDFKKALVIHNH